MLDDLLGLLFPKLCVGCNAALLKNETFICTTCHLHLPLTHYHRQPGNALEKLFWGRAEVVRAFSLLHFRKGSITQHLLHELKYKGNKELGHFIGRMYGQMLKGHTDIDAVMAIPLHPSKLRKRGYNQSDFFAEGLAGQLGIQNLSPFVVRNKATETQTKKSRFERWENVADVFAVKQADALKDRHILLVDDVITTGATIEACVNGIRSNVPCRLSIASIAMATH